MKSIIRYLIRHEVLVNLGILLFTIFGLTGAAGLTSSFFPEQETKFIKVEAEQLGASPSEIEEGITLKIEDNLKGITGVDRITSTSSQGKSVVKVELLPKADEDEVLEEVKNAVDRISSFPPDIERVVVYKEEIVNFTAKFALSGDVSLKALKEKAQLAEDELRNSDGISKIQISGYPEEEIEISVREQALRAYGMTFEDISRAVASENIEISGGKIRGQRTELLIKADNKAYHADDLENLIVRTAEDGQVVRVRDVARIKDTWSENTDRASFNGTRAVIITVNTTNEEDILSAVEAIRSYIEGFNARNTAVKATLIDDATTTLRERIGLLEENGFIGAFLVLLVLGLFLNPRLAFWVAIGIPVSFLGMFVLASFYGLTINVLSLFGMIIVVGILVDDGVVVGENIYQHFERGKTPFRAALEGTLEVLPSILSSITTTAVAFGFFFFIEGRLGEFFSDVAFVVIASLIISFIEVNFFLPSHLAHSKALVRNQKGNKVLEKVSNALLTFREKAYRPALNFVMLNKAFTVFFFAGFMVITIGAVRGGIIRTTFFPNIERNSVKVTLEMPAGTNDNVTEGILQQVEEAAYRLNRQYRQEYDTDQKLVLKIEKTLGPNSNQGKLVAYLQPAETRSLRSFKVASMLREETGPVPSARKLSFETETPFGKPVSISLSSKDFDKLRQAKYDLKAALNDMETLRDVIDNDQEDQPEIDIRLKDKARLLGMNLQEVLAQVRNGFFGREAQRLQRGINEVKVWVRYEMEDRDQLRNLADMRIRTPDGGSYPLGQLAEIEQTKGMIAINHRGGQREIKVEADIASLEVSAPEQIAYIRDNILPGLLAKYPGTDATFEGQVRTTRKTQRSAQAAGPLILVVMVSILVFSFRSFWQAAVLLLVIPLGFVGAAWGHVIHGQPISILSGLGLVALIGILVNGGLVYINSLNLELKDGKGFMQAVRDTGLSRFRPIVLTAMTTVAGLTPLIFETSFQAQFLIPMAISIAYGLLFGMLLILLLLPALLILANQLRVHLVWLWEGRKPAMEEVEHASQEQHETAGNYE